MRFKVEVFLALLFGGLALIGLIQPILGYIFLVLSGIILFDIITARKGYKINLAFPIKLQHKQGGKREGAMRANHYSGYVYMGEKPAGANLVVMAKVGDYTSTPVTTNAAGYYHSLEVSPPNDSYIGLPTEFYIEAKKASRTLSYMGGGHSSSFLNLEYESEIKDKIEIDIHKHLVRQVGEIGYFPIDVEFTLKVQRLPIQLAKAQLCILDEIIDPVTISPTIPRTLEANVETYSVKYKPTYEQFLKSRIITDNRERELKLQFSRARWRREECKAHLRLTIEGKEEDFPEFTFDHESSH